MMKMKERRQTSFPSCIRCMMRAIKDSISRGFGTAVMSSSGCCTSTVRYEKNGMKFTKPFVGISTFHCFIPKLCSFKSMEFSVTLSC